MRFTDLPPGLRRGLLLPRTMGLPRTLPVFRWAARRFPADPAKAGAEIARVDADVTVRVFRPPETTGGPGAALLWIHGGGMVLGTAGGDDALCRCYADDLGLLVVSVEYRLAPEHPFPTPLEDCHAALLWLARRADVDSRRIAIGGASAGGGLAAGLALLARQRGEVVPAFQLLVYPMLDDRTCARTDVDRGRLRLWGPRDNRFGWASYLGGLSGAEVSPLAAPARHGDLAGSPPAWIGVGTLDLFHDEDLAYARRLQAADVETTVVVVPGAFHGFDVIGRGPVVGDFRASQLAALRTALA